MNKSKNQQLIGHLLALFTIIVWGTTFIATKLLLTNFSPIHIMLMRFTLAYVVLFILKPKPLFVDVKTEAQFALLGLFGCTLYFLTENNALTYTYAANVSIIVASAPILTALLVHLFHKEEKVDRNNIYGFLIAFLGVAMVVFNGTVVLKLNPKGDILSLLSAFTWAMYSLLQIPLLKRFDAVLLTRRVMLWGFITVLPVALISGKPIDFTPLLHNGTELFCILFLGIIGSGICYVTWNLATRRLGVVITSNYIYINPFVTMVTAALVLHERVTWMGVAGAVLIICGVIFSDRGKAKK